MPTRRVAGRSTSYISAVEEQDPEAEERIAHLLVALEHRTVLGQATGMVMERYEIDADAAFRTLVRLASDQRRKVYEIAQELVATRCVRGLGTQPRKAPSVRGSRMVAEPQDSAS